MASGALRRYSAATQIEGFEILRRLGRGGMGEVFEARRTGPGGFRRAVALKRLVGDAAVRGISVQRFLAEARTLASLHHPNVLEIYDIVPADSGYVLVMELLTGATLGALVREAATAGGLAVDELCAIADQALAGLDYIHHARGDDDRPLGLIHRDVTPSNVFVTHLGKVKLIDFGIAKLRAAHDVPVTRDGEIYGTLELIAPEQAQGTPADPRTDLYQLGATLYWALTGRYPHGTGTVVELVARAVSVRPPLLAELRPDLSAALTATIDRAMAIDPADRFADAAALRDALQPFLANDGDARLAARIRALPGRTASDLAVDDPGPPTPPSERLPETVPDKPNVLRAAPHEDSRILLQRRRRRWPIAVIAGSVVAGAMALWLTGWPTQEVTVEVTDIPIAQGALAAAPLPDDRVAFVTDGEVRIASTRGGETVPVKLPESTGFIVSDVVAVDGARLAVSGRTRHGILRIYLSPGQGQDIFFRSPDDIMAVSPDGNMLAISSLQRGVTVEHLSGDHDDSRTILQLPNGEIAVAMGWSPDSRQLAVAIDRGHAPAAFVVFDVTTNERRELTHAAFEGEIAVFGWLDQDHLVYAVNNAGGAALRRFSIQGQTEQPIVQWQGERILGGHVAQHRIAFLHGPVHRKLLVGTPDAMKEVLGDEVTSIGGFDRDGRVVLGLAAGRPVARDVTGISTPWPHAEQSDQPQTLADGTLLAIRGSAVYRIGPSSQPILAVAPRNRATVRCAGDATLPCVALDWSAGAPQIRTINVAESPDKTRYVTNGSQVDFAVSSDGHTLATVDGSGWIRFVAINASTDGPRDRKISVGVIDAVAWSGDKLIVSVRGWKQKRWALLAVAANEPPDNNTREVPARLITEAPECVAAEIRATESALAVLTTNVTPTLSVLHIR